jgi:cation diffusion facilitator family transporter
VTQLSASNSLSAANFRELSLKKSEIAFGPVKHLESGSNPGVFDALYERAKDCGAVSAGESSVRVILIALLANAGIAVAKFVGAFISGSAALLAEAIHSLVDCTNQVLLLVGNKGSKRPPSATHPLGYGREAFFWSFIVALLLFSLGGLFAIYEGVHKLSGHEAVASPALGLGILVFSLILEGFSLRACLKEVREQNTYGSLWAWFRRTTSSELLVVFTEDMAAMAGLTLAMLSLLLSWVTHNSMWDAIGSIAVGGVLITVAMLLAVEIKSLIVGEAPSTDFRSYIERRLQDGIPGARVFNLIALQLGPGEVMLSCKISAGSIKDVDVLIEAINAMERDIKKQFPEVRWSFFEPDTTD